MINWRKQMRFDKTELIQLHTLFCQVDDFISEDGETSLEEYDDMNIGPMAIHKPRLKHQEAVQTLADDISAEIEDETTEELLA